MTEAMAIEAVRAVGGANWMQQAAAVPQTLDPNAVAAFAEAKAAPAPDAIPFVRQISETRRSAEVGNHLGAVHPKEEIVAEPLKHDMKETIVQARVNSAVADMMK